MLPIMISSGTSLGIILKILGIKFLIGIIVGVIVDLFTRKTNSKPNDENTIKEICEHDHCHCEDGIFKPALKHTLNVIIFIFIITLFLNMLILLIGENILVNNIIDKPIIGPMISGLIGLIPNCAASVVITELYLSEVISFGSMLAGILVGSGLGLLILFKVNRNIKENIKILGILYSAGVLIGMVAQLTGLNI